MSIAVRNPVMQALCSHHCVVQMNSGNMNQIDNPVCLRVCASNHEAHLTVAQLASSGIYAVTIEDMSPAGLIAIGTLPEIHRPQVFVDESDLEAATKIVSDPAASLTADAPTECFCYHCGFNNPDRLPTCPQCGGTIEVDIEPKSDSSPAKSNESLQSSKRLVALAILTPVIAVPLFFLWLFLSRLF